MSIAIRSSRIWGKSRYKLIRALGRYYTETNPTIVFDITNQPIMTNKIIMNKKFDELKIRHPKTYYHPFDDLPNTDEECVVKHQFGSLGNHLTFTKFNRINKNDLYDKYVQHYIPFEKEYRVGINWNRVLGIREKILSDDCDCRRIKNSRSCYYETRENYKLNKFAWKIFKKFGVEFTGMDIGEWKGEYIVIELNSSPAIGNYWARLLAGDLIEKLRGV